MPKKITPGFVVQDYTIDGRCTSSEFVASDQVEWEDTDGRKMGELIHIYHPFDMVQPGPVKLKLVETGRGVYGNDGDAINRHSVREYLDTSSGLRYRMDRVLDADPKFYQSYGPYTKGYIGLLPVLEVSGAKHWGDGLSWEKAEKLFLETINATLEGRMEC